jgi:hypothetical protein
MTHNVQGLPAVRILAFLLPGTVVDFLFKAQDKNFVQ